jgi:hypothetical protein
VEDRDRQALSICSPILQEFRATAMAATHLDHTDTEYPQFHRNGLLRELFYEIDLVPKECAVVFLLGTFIPSVCALSLIVSPFLEQRS